MSKERNYISNIINTEDTNKTIINLDPETNELILENYIVPINYSYEPRFRKPKPGYEDLNLDFNEHHGKENAKILYDKIVKYALNKTGFEVQFYESNTETQLPGVRITIRTDTYNFMSIPLTKEVRDTKIKI